MNSLATAPTALYDHPKYWAECLLPAPFLPMSREEMDQMGWDSCDVILVTGDAYVDHPSFGMAVIGRVLENWTRAPLIQAPHVFSASATRGSAVLPSSGIDSFARGMNP